MNKIRDKEIPKIKETVSGSGRNELPDSLNYNLKKLIQKIQTAQKINHQTLIGYISTEQIFA